MAKVLPPDRQKDEYVYAEDAAVKVILSVQFLTFTLLTLLVWFVGQIRHMKDVPFGSCAVSLWLVL